MNWFQHYSNCFDFLDYPPLICDLPSYGKIYNPESILYKTKKVFSKKIDGKIEEWGTDTSVIHKDSKYLLNYLLDKLIIHNDTKVSIDEYIPADRDSIVLKHLVSTYGNTLSSLKIECYNCYREFDTKDIVIEKYWRENLEIEPIEDGKNIFETRVDQYIFKFKLLTIKDEYDIEQFEKDNDYKSWFKYSKMIYSINGDTNIKQLVMNNKIKKKVLYKFSKYVESITPYIRIVTNEIICPHCTEDNKIETNINIDLLPIHGESIKELASTEYILLQEQIKGLDYTILYHMPIENRKRLYKKHAEIMKEREEHKAKNAG